MVGQLRRFRSTNLHDDEMARPIILVVETYEAITLIKGPERVETHVRYLINGMLESGPLDVIERYTEPVDEAR